MLHTTGNITCHSKPSYCKRLSVAMYHGRLAASETPDYYVPSPLSYRLHECSKIAAKFSSHPGSTYQPQLAGVLATTDFVPHQARGI